MSEQMAKARSRTPWVGLAAAVWVLFVAANNYNFALFSPAPKSVLGDNQQQVAILGVANDLGSNIGVLAGVALNYYSPCQVILFGSVFCLLGNGLIWLAVMKKELGTCLSLSGGVTKKRLHHLDPSLIKDMKIRFSTPLTLNDPKRREEMVLGRHN